MPHNSRIKTLNKFVALILSVGMALPNPAYALSPTKTMNSVSTADQLWVDLAGKLPPTGIQNVTSSSGASDILWLDQAGKRPTAAEIQKIVAASSSLLMADDKKTQKGQTPSGVAPKQVLSHEPRAMSHELISRAELRASELKSGSETTTNGVWPFASETLQEFARRLRIVTLNPEQWDALSPRDLQLANQIRLALGHVDGGRMVADPQEFLGLSLRIDQSPLAQEAIGNLSADDVMQRLSKNKLLSRAELRAPVEVQGHKVWTLDDGQGNEFQVTEFGAAVLGLKTSGRELLYHPSSDAKIKNDDGTAVSGGIPFLGGSNGRIPNGIMTTMDGAKVDVLKSPMTRVMPNPKGGFFAQHGFTDKINWHVVEPVGENHIILSIAAKEIPMNAPGARTLADIVGDVKWTQAYHIENGQLTSMLTVEGDGILGGGYHPYYQLKDLSDWDITIPATKVWGMDSTPLPLNAEPMDVEGSVWDFRKPHAITPGLEVTLSDFESEQAEIVLKNRKTGEEIKIALNTKDFPYVMLWVKPDASGIFSVEPLLTMPNGREMALAGNELVTPLVVSPNSPRTLTWTFRYSNPARAELRAKNSELGRIDQVFENSTLRKLTPNTLGRQVEPTDPVKFRSKAKTAKANRDVDDALEGLVRALGSMVKGVVHSETAAKKAKRSELRTGEWQKALRAAGAVVGAVTTMALSPASTTAQVSTVPVSPTAQVGLVTDGTNTVTTRTDKGIDVEVRGGGSYPYTYGGVSFSKPVDMSSVTNLGFAGAINGQVNMEWTDTAGRRGTWSLQDSLTNSFKYYLLDPNESGNLNPRQIQSVMIVLENVTNGVVRMHLPIYSQIQVNPQPSLDPSSITRLAKNADIYTIGSTRISPRGMWSVLSATNNWFALNFDAQNIHKLDLSGRPYINLGFGFLKSANNKNPTTIVTDAEVRLEDRNNQGYTFHVTGLDYSEKVYQFLVPQVAGFDSTNILRAVVSIYPPQAGATNQIPLYLTQVPLPTILQTPSPENHYSLTFRSEPGESYYVLGSSTLTKGSWYNLTAPSLLAQSTTVTTNVPSWGLSGTNDAAFFYKIGVGDKYTPPMGVLPTYNLSAPVKSLANPPRSELRKAEYDFENPRFRTAPEVEGLLWMPTKQIPIPLPNGKVIGVVPQVNQLPALLDTKALRSTAEVEKILDQHPELTAYLRGADAGGSSIDLIGMQEDLNIKGMSLLDWITSTTVITSGFRVKITLSRAGKSDANEYVVKRPVVDAQGKTTITEEKVEWTKKSQLVWDAKLKSYVTPRGQMDAFGFLMGLFNVWGVKGEFEYLDPEAAGGAFGTSGASTAMFLQAASMLSDAGLSQADIQAMSVYFENTVFKGYTGGQESFSTLLGGIHQGYWLGYVPTAGKKLLYPYSAFVLPLEASAAQRKELASHFIIVQPSLTYKDGKKTEDRTAAMVNFNWIDGAKYHSSEAFPWHQEKILLANQSAFGIETGNWKEVIQALNRHRVVRDFASTWWFRMAMDAKNKVAGTPSYAQKFLKRVEEAMQYPEDGPDVNVRALKHNLVRYGFDRLAKDASLYSVTSMPFIEKIAQALGQKQDDPNFGVGLFLPGAGGPGTPIFTVTETPEPTRAQLKEMGYDRLPKGTDLLKIMTGPGENLLKGQLDLTIGEGIQMKNWPDSVKAPARGVKARYRQADGAILLQEKAPALEGVGRIVQPGQTGDFKNTVRPNAFNKARAELRQEEMTVQKEMVLGDFIQNEISKQVDVREDGFEIFINGPVKVGSQVRNWTNRNFRFPDGYFHEVYGIDLEDYRLLPGAVVRVVRAELRTSPQGQWVVKDPVANFPAFLKGIQALKGKIESRTSKDRARTYQVDLTMPNGAILQKTATARKSQVVWENVITLVANKFFVSAKVTRSGREDTLTYVIEPGSISAARFFGNIKSHIMVAATKVPLKEVRYHEIKPSANEIIPGFDFYLDPAALDELQTKIWEDVPANHPARELQNLGFGMIHLTSSRAELRPKADAFGTSKNLRTGRSEVRMDNLPLAPAFVDGKGFVPAVIQEARKIATTQEHPEWVALFQTVAQQLGANDESITHLRSLVGKQMPGGVIHTPENFGILSILTQAEETVRARAEVRGSDLGNAIVAAELPQAKARLEAAVQQAEVLPQDNLGELSGILEIAKDLAWQMVSDAEAAKPDAGSKQLSPENARLVAVAFKDFHADVAALAKDAAVMVPAQFVIELTIWKSLDRRIAFIKDQVTQRVLRNFEGSAFGMRLRYEVERLLATAKVMSIFPTTEFAVYNYLEKESGSALNAHTYLELSKLSMPQLSKLRDFMRSEKYAGIYVGPNITAEQLVGWINGNFQDLPHVVSYRAHEKTLNIESRSEARATQRAELRSDGLNWETFGVTLPGGSVQVGATATTSFAEWGIKTLKVTRSHPEKATSRITQMASNVEFEHTPFKVLEEGKTPYDQFIVTRGVPVQMPDASEQWILDQFTSGSIQLVSLVKAGLSQFIVLPDGAAYLFNTETGSLDVTKKFEARTDGVLSQIPQVQAFLKSEQPKVATARSAESPLRSMVVAAPAFVFASNFVSNPPSQSPRVDRSELRSATLAEKPDTLRRMVPPASVPSPVDFSKILSGIQLVSPNHLKVRAGVTSKLQEAMMFTPDFVFDKGGLPLIPTLAGGNPTLVIVRSAAERKMVEDFNAKLPAVLPKILIAEEAEGAVALLRQQIVSGLRLKGGVQAGAMRIKAVATPLADVEALRKAIGDNVFIATQGWFDRTAESAGLLSVVEKFRTALATGKSA